MVNENKKYIVYGCIAIVVLLLAAILLCWDVPDNTAGINNTREQLNSAEERGREITDGIIESQKRTENIADRIDRSQEANNSATERADRIETNLSDADRIIAECQQILRNIRSRGEEKAEAD